MNHQSEKSMLFHFLQGNNYNQSLDKLKMDMGYDLGDYSFKNQKTSQKAVNIATQIWVELKDHFNDEGN